MRIALVHSYYSSRQPSGENIAVDAQADALRASGHDVIVVASRSDDREAKRSYPLAAAWTVATGRGADPAAELAAFDPALVHVHNLFPNFGTRWLETWRTPIVATLHNFRPMCPAGTFYRNGQLCTNCADGSVASAVRHGCYRGSRLATVPVSIGRRGGLSADPVVKHAGAIVLLTEIARDIYTAYGADARKLHVVPNFLSDEIHITTKPPSNRRWVYVGRLSEEKGVAELVAAWPRDVPLDIIGSGPLAEQLSRAGKNEIHLMGEVDRSELRRLLPAYEGMVFPGRCTEGGHPLAVLEALQAGLPVVAVQGSSVAELVLSDQLGLVVGRSADSRGWLDAVQTVTAGRLEFSAAARHTYETGYTQQMWLDRIQSLYEAVLERRDAAISK